MTEADWESLIARVEPFALVIANFVRSAVRLCIALALMAGGAVSAAVAIVELQLSDAALLQQIDGHAPPSLSGQRLVLALLLAAFVVMALRGWDRFKRWCQPRDQHARRVAELERQLIEVGQFADDAAQSAAEAEWARDALEAVADVFKIPGVLDAARKAARKALHPDAHAGASEPEIRDLTERFQMAEAVFDRFSNA
jgi:hypothetical protein